MESLLSTLHMHAFKKSSFCNHKPLISPNSPHLSIRRLSFVVSQSKSVINDDVVFEGGRKDWELEFLGELKVERSGGDKEDVDVRSGGKVKERLGKSELLKDTDSMDWCVRARKVALKSIEARGLSSNMENFVNGKKKKKKKKKKVVRKDKVAKKSGDFDEGGDSDLDRDGDGEEEIVDIDTIDQLLSTVSGIGGGMFEEKKEKNREIFIERLSQFSGPSDRRKEINLNKAIVDAQTAEEVLDVAAETLHQSDHSCLKDIPHPAKESMAVLISLPQSPNKLL